MMSHRRLTPALLALWLGALLSVANAQPQPDGTLQIAGRMPADIDFLLAVTDLRTLRASETGDRVEDLARRMAPMNPAVQDMVEHWGTLADALGFDDPRAMFDEFFGQRFVIASRAAGGRGSAGVLVADVSRSMERRIRDRMALAPRSAYRGFNVLRPRTEGRLDLVLTRTPDGAAARLVMSTVGRDDLFRDVLDIMADESVRTFAAVDAFPSLAALDPSPRACLFLNANRPETPGYQWLGATASASAKGRRLDIRFAGRLAADVQQPPAATWPSALFNKWRARSYVMLLGSDGVTRAATLLLSQVLPASAPNFTNARIPEHTNANRGLIMAPSADGGFIDIAWVVGMDHEPDSFKAADDLVEQRVSRGLSDEDRALVGVQFGGAFPNALRTADLSPLRNDVDLNAWPRGPVLAWCYPASERRGWWVTGYGRGLVENLRADLEDADDAEDASPHVSVGAIRLNALARRMNSLDRDMPPLLEAAIETVEDVSWETHRHTDLVIGSARITFVQGRTSE